MLSNIKYVLKRDGFYSPFDISKIKNAVRKAFAEVHLGEKWLKKIKDDPTWEPGIFDLPGQKYNRYIVWKEAVALVTENIGTIVEKDYVAVEKVQDLVEKAIAEVDVDVALAYAKYRSVHSYVRANRDNLYAQIDAHRKSSDRSNANVLNGPMAKMLQIGGDATKAFALDRIIPYEFSQAHKNGDIYIHDLDFYLLTINCLQIPVAKMFKEGFNAGHGFVRPPKRIESAAALACIILQASQNDFYGGQSIPAFDALLAPFCGPEVSDERIRSEERRGRERV